MSNGDSGGAGAPADWTLRATGPTPVAGAGNSAAVTHRAVNAGSYTLAESGGPTGYAAGNWLFYATGGYAWMNTTATRSQLAGTINAAIPGTVESASATVGGWAAGAGIEWGITPNVSIKAEYLHYDFQNTRFVFPLANRRWDDNTVKDSVKIGVNWRLNWGP